MTVFADALDEIFSDTNFGEDATYTAPGGSPVPCRIVATRQDRFMHIGDGRPVMAGTVIEVLSSVVAAPVKEGVFTIGTTTARIVDSPVADDANRLVWRCTVR